MGTSAYSTEEELFRYQLLDRCKQDCLYFLGHGGRHEKYLWGGSVDEHIQTMFALWDSFPREGKPDWLTREQIAYFEVLMKGGLIQPMGPLL